MPWPSFSWPFRRRHQKRDGPAEEVLADFLYVSLRTGLTDFRQEGEYWTKPFIDKNIQDDVVRQELDKAREEYDDALVKYIVEDAKKLFLVSVVSFREPTKVLRAMKLFQAYGYRDGKEPTQFTIQKESKHFSGLERDSFRGMDQKLWSPANTGSFCENQWKALVPVLSTETQQYEFGGRTILPFTRIHHDGMAGGTFAKVYRIKIEQGHFVDPGRKESEWPQSFAVKEIVPPTAEERDGLQSRFKNEVETLSRMSNNEHIVRFITSFTKGDTSSKSYNLIFEWADGGSLEDLFAQRPEPKLTADLVRQALNQLKGLADALRATHGENIRHGDLKPANILRFEPTEHNIFGKLKLGDWGLAKTHGQSTAMRGRKGLATTTKYGTPLYEPPEVEGGDVTLLSRQYDVWSMGVIILELMNWLLYGKDGVKQFRRDVQDHSKIRPACYETAEHTQMPRTAYKVHETVDFWISHIVHLAVCEKGTALGSLIDLVRNRLLVVNIPTGMRQTGTTTDLPASCLNGQGVNQSSTPASSPAPKIIVTAPIGHHNDEPSTGSKQQDERATSEELFEKLTKDVLGDPNRPTTYWLRNEDIPRRIPNFNSSSRETRHVATGTEEAHVRE